MNADRVRRFTLLDALTLVGATAIGLGISRSIIITFSRLRDAANAGFAGDPVIEKIYIPMQIFIMSLLFSLSIAIVPLRLRRPRPPRPLWRAGIVPCWAPPLTLAYGILLEIPPALTYRDDFNLFAHFLSWYILGNVTDAAGLTVAAGWTALALRMRGRRRRDWIDMVGIALGASWIILSLLNPWVYYYWA